MSGVLPALTTLDRLRVASSVLLPAAALVGLVVSPSWALAAVTLLFALAPVCIALAFLRRRRAFAMTAGSTDPQVARRAAALHLQSSGLFLLAVAVICLAVIPWRTLY